jgi:sulfate adenylyltransferase
MNEKYLIKSIYGTLDEKHPGVSQTMLSSSDYISGDLESFIDSTTWKVLNYFHPQESKAIFKDRGWQTIAGFQTRNVPHFAHEYIQRICMELLDGLFIQPILGHKKIGDFTPEAVSHAYKNLMDRYYPKDKVIYSGLYTHMRYAGPKEAILHSILRRNYGCTHFVIGRDHAGVGNYYGIYEAQSLAKSYESELDIKILAFSEPFYCTVCKTIVTKNNCQHTSNPKLVTQISGTQLRDILIHNGDDSSVLFRKDLLDGFDMERLLIK